jgi:hypothetical protein
VTAFLLAAASVAAICLVTLMSGIGMSTTEDLVLIAVADGLTFAIGGFTLGRVAGKAGVIVASLLSLVAISLLAQLAVDVVIAPGASALSPGGLGVVGLVGLFTVTPAVALSTLGWWRHRNVRSRRDAEVDRILRRDPED